VCVDSSTGGTGGSGGYCDQLDPEPNDTFESAPLLSAITDCDETSFAISGTLSDPYDADYITFDANDTVGCSVNPRMTIDTPNTVLACMYFTCPSGDVELDCAGSSFKEVTDPERLGCCAYLTNGTIEADVNCTGSTEDSTWVWLHVSSSGVSSPMAECQDYTVSFTY
jgi:hypothetical protein